VSYNIIFFILKKLKEIQRNKYYIMLLYWIILTALVILNAYLKIDIERVYLLLVLFLFVYAVMILIRKEKDFLGILQQSIFSKYALSVVLLSYLLTVGWIHIQLANEMEYSPKYKSIQKHFSHSVLSERIEDTFLLNKLLVLNINEGITNIEIQKKMIEPYQGRKDIAFCFRPANELDSLYTLYPYNYKNLAMNLLFAYFVLFLFSTLFFFLHQGKATSKRKVKDILVTAIVGFFLFGILGGEMIQGAWSSIWPVTVFEGKDYFRKHTYIQALKEYEYRIILAR